MPFTDPNGPSIHRMEAMFLDGIPGLSPWPILHGSASPPMVPACSLCSSQIGLLVSFKHI